MGKPVASVAGRGRAIDFALIGHQESWQAAADVLAALRGPQYPPLPDDEIRDMLSSILCRCTGYDNIIKAVRAAGRRGMD